MADAYKVVEDISIPRALRLLSEDEIEGKTYETVGVNYPEGSFVLEDEITPPLREKAAEDGFDGRLEPITDTGEVEEARRFAERRGRFGVFVPEHETEREALLQAGHDVVSKQDTLELLSAGADEAKEAIEQSREDDFDARPNLTTEEDLPSLAEASREGEVVAGTEERATDDLPDSVQALPSGVIAGQDKEDRETVMETVPRKAKAARSRPQRKAADKADDKKPEGNES